MARKSCPHCLRRKFLLWTGAFAFALMGTLGGLHTSPRAVVTSSSVTATASR
jgi:hypothetical protein